MDTPDQYIQFAEDCDRQAATSELESSRVKLQATAEIWRELAAISSRGHPTSKLGSTPASGSELWVRRCDMQKRYRPKPPPIDPADQLEEILSAADALIRRRMKLAGLVAAHVILAAGPAGIGVIRSNVGAGVMLELAAMLKDTADQVLAAPSAAGTTH